MEMFPKRLDRLRLDTRDGVAVHPEPIRVPGEILLVQHPNESRPRNRLNFLNHVPAFVGIDHVEDQFGSGDLGPRALDPFPLDRLSPLTDPRRVDESQGNPLEIDELFNRVAGGTCQIADNSAVETQQTIEQTRFSGIRRPADHGPDSFPQDASLLSGGEEVVKLPGDLIHRRNQGLHGVRLDVFFGKVDVGLDMRQQSNEILADPLDLDPEPACELFTGSPDCEIRLGRNQIHDRLGLGEVDASVEERPLRERTGSRRLGPGRENRLEDPSGDQHATMTADFDDVFARETFRPGKISEQAFVNPLTFRTDQPPPVLAPGPPPGRRAPREDPGGDPGRIRTTDADQGNRTHSRRAGHCGNRRNLHGRSVGKSVCGPGEPESGFH